MKKLFTFLFFLGTAIFHNSVQSAEFVFPQNEFSILKLDEALSPQDIIKVLKNEALDYRALESSHIFLVDLEHKKVFTQKSNYGDTGWSYCWTVAQKNCEEMFEWISPKPVFSEDLSQMAYVAKQGSEYFIIHNGKKSAAYDDLRELYIPFGEKTLYYIARQGKEEILYAGEEPLHRYVKIRALEFLPQIKGYVFKAQKKKKWIYNINGEESPEFDRVSSIVWNSDEKNFIFFGYKDFRYFEVNWPIKSQLKMLPEDLERFPERIFFDEEKKLNITEQRRKRKSFFVVNGKASRFQFDVIEKIHFDEENEKLHFVGVKRFENKEERFDYFWDPREDRLFKPGNQNGKNKDASILVVIRQDPSSENFPAGSQSIIVNGKILKSYSKNVKIKELLFSEEDKHFAYVLQKSKRQSVMVEEGEEKAKYQEIMAPSYSPKGKSLAFIGRQNGKEMFVKDFVESEVFDRIDPILKEGKRYKFLWSDSGTLTAFLAFQEGKFYVVINEKKHGPFELVSNIFYDANSKRLGWLASEALELKWHVVPFN